MYDKYCDQCDKRLPLFAEELNEIGKRGERALHDIPRNYKLIPQNWKPLNYFPDAEATTDFASKQMEILNNFYSRFKEENPNLDMERRSRSYHQLTTGQSWTSTGCDRLWHRYTQNRKNKMYFIVGYGRFREVPMKSGFFRRERSWPWSRLVNSPKYQGF